MAIRRKRRGCDGPPPRSFLAGLTCLFAACASHDSPSSVDASPNAPRDVSSETPRDAASGCHFAPSPFDTLTFHRDRQRRGWDPNEPELTPEAVGGPRFGSRWSSPPLDDLTIGGQTYAPHIYATPLYVDRVCVSGGNYDGLGVRALFTATSSGYAYAIAASGAKLAGRDVAAGAILWRTRLGAADVVPDLDGGVPMGVLSTPVVDLVTSPPRLYVVSMDATAGWQAFALDIGSGAVLPGWPVAITDATVGAKNRNGPASMQEAHVLSQRSALNLSLAGDLLYVPFGGYSDGGIGWLVAIDTRRAAIAAAFSGAPSAVATANGGMWGPGGVTIDDDGTVCATTGNSPPGSDTTPNVWGQTLLCFDPTLHLEGTFTPFNYCQMDVGDTDLGGSSPMLLPTLGTSTTTKRLTTFGGKQGTVYLIDRDHLPGRTDRRPPCSTDSTTDASLLPKGTQPQFGVPGPLNVFGPYSEQYDYRDHAKMRSTPAYFHDAAGRDLVFVSGATKRSVASVVSAAPSFARLRVATTPGAAAYLEIDAYQPTLAFINAGSPVVTSDGAANPIAWVFDENAPRTASLVDPRTAHPMLHAIDATTMTAIWHTNPKELFVGGKYTTITAAHGVVFVGTDRIQAFGVR